MPIYRRTGADLPRQDPGGAHGVPMEGHFWRIVAPEVGRALIVLCGACRTDGRDWALVAAAAEPGHLAAETVVDEYTLDPDELGVWVPGVLDGSARHLRARVGDLHVDVRLGEGHRAPRALGPAHLLPFLPQYWQPLVLAAPVRGSATLGGEEVDLRGATAYVEKNWGHGFAGEWWWGHAELGDVTVAFAGGPIGPVRPTSLVVRVGDEVHAITPPLGLVRADVGSGEWRIRARRRGISVLLEGEGDEPFTLPVPDVRAGIARPRSRQHVAARVRVRIGGRTYESALAGLESGLAR